MVGLSVLICLIGIFSPNRLSGLEIMFVVQYAFVSLIWCSKITLTSYSLNGLKYATGYNIKFGEIPEVDEPPYASLYEVDGLFFYNNFNVFGITYLVPLVGFLITKSVYNRYNDKHDLPELVKGYDIDRKFKLKEKYRKKIEKRLSRAEFFSESMFYIVMFNLTLFTTSTLIFYSHGNVTDIASNVLVGVFFLITLLSFLFYFCYPSYFLRFHYSFHPETLKFNHYFFHILNIVLSLVLTSTLLDYPWAAAIPQVLLFLYTLIQKPYNYSSENYRSAFNLFTMCVITSMRIFFFYITDKILSDERTNIYPIVVEGLLFLGIVWAYYSVLKDMIIEYILKKNNKNIPYDLYEEQ